MRKLMMAAVMGLAMQNPAKEYIEAPEAKGGIEPPTKEWIDKIAALAPAAPTAAPARPRKIVVFSLATGFQHAVKPHVVEVFKVLGRKSGAFDAAVNDDIGVFEVTNLHAFDAVVLNNVCPKGPGRDLFSDVLGHDQKTAQFESNLVSYVENGGGLIVMHGGIAFQNNSMAVSTLIGGSFDWHPKNQRVTVEPVDPKHPLVAAFEGKGFVHTDEPYLFKNAYKDLNFRPLLELDMSSLDPQTFKKPVNEGPRYVAWIRPHGKGRVFFCSPSHQPESYETAAMLRFLLDGTQYALGDLKCDDSPIGAE